MANKATLDYSGSHRLVEAMSKIPSKSEEVVNRVLKNRGAKEVIQGIIGFMPVSKRNKNHAKFSNPLKEVMFNLGFDVIAKGGAAKNKGSYGYLVFPNEGRGPSNPVAQQFFEKGLASREDIILDYVIDELVRAQEELLSV